MGISSEHHPFSRGQRSLFLIAALIYGALLLVAGLLKIETADPALGWASSWIGMGEVVTGSFLVIYHQKMWVWALSGWMSAAWAGYALFWAVQGLPCGCFGSMAEFSSGAALGMDLAFWLCALWKLSHRRLFYFLLSSILFVFGFVFGSLILDLLRN